MKGIINNMNLLIFYIIFLLRKLDCQIIENNLNQTNIDNENNCSSSFQCLSGCCYDNKCQNSTSQCELIITKAYIISGCIALIVLSLGIVYLYNEIKKTKINVENIRNKQNNIKIE